MNIDNRPKQVTIAAVLFVASGGLNAVDFFVREGDRNALGYLHCAGTTAFLILFAALWMRGVNLARWIYLGGVVVFLLGLPGSFQHGFSGSIFSKLYYCLQTLLQVSPALLLFSRSSSEWFQEQTNDAS